VSSADLVIKNQQGIKPEIEARADRFSSCINMGQELLARSHYAAEEVSEAWQGLANLTDQGSMLIFPDSFCFLFLARNLSLSVFSVLFRDFPQPTFPP
jgi:hypothetical protein